MSKQQSDAKQMKKWAPRKSENIEQLILTALCTPIGEEPAGKLWDMIGIPVILWGPPGIGKSSRVKAAARAMNEPFELIYPAGRQPEDFSGVPVARPEGGLDVECIMAAVNKLAKIGHGIIFFEDMSGTRPATQAALLGAILDRRFGDKEVPGLVRMAAAANPPESGAGAHMFEAPLANRFMHVFMDEPSGRQWMKWFLGTNETLPVLSNAMQQVQQGWSTHWPDIQGLWAAFFGTHREDLLYELPPVGSDKRGYAWPSPRTIVWGAHALTTARCLGMSTSIQEEVLAGVVGDSVASTLLTYMTEANLPKPIHMVDHGWRPDAARMDIAFGAFASLGAFFKNNPKMERKEQRAVRAWQIMQAACEMSMPDTIFECARMMVKAKLGTTMGGDVEKAAKPVLARLFATGISAAGQALEEDVA